MKPDVRTYDAFFQSIVRQYGLLVGFDPQTQPLSVAGARQIIASVVGRHVDEIVQLPVDMARSARWWMPWAHWRTTSRIR